MLAKYNYQQSVRSKVADIKTEVQKFKQAFLPLFQMGLLDFWDSENKLVPEAVYKEFMVKARLDHAKFKDMVKGLSGQLLVTKLRDDFMLPVLFRIITSNLPLITHDSLIELDVLQKEMMDDE